MIDIPGDYLEGGGQILRTASALSCICNLPIHVFNIRAKREKPGLKPQHLIILKTLANLFEAKTTGLELGSTEITFTPTLKTIQTNRFDIDVKTAGSIGLILQPLILVAGFRGNKICFNIKGGTSGVGAIPVEYYRNVIFQILSKVGLKTSMEIIKRGYYPKGGGEVEVVIGSERKLGKIDLVNPCRLIRIEGISIASSILAGRRVAERQAEKATEILKEKYSVPINIKYEYCNTFSIGSEVNIYAFTEKGCILGSDSRGERGKTAEKVAIESVYKLITEIESGAGVDIHLADNIIPWLCLLGGQIKTSQISMHTKTNIWVCELFFGKVFDIKGNKIACKRCLD